MNVIPQAAPRLVPTLRDHLSAVVMLDFSSWKTRLRVQNVVMDSGELTAATCVAVNMLPVAASLQDVSVSWVGKGPTVM